MIRIGIFFGLAMAVLAGLWMLLKPLQPPASPPALAAPQAAASGAPAPASLPVEATVVVPAPKRFELDPQANGTVMQVQVGDDVELTITTAGNDELHLHGYDLALPLRAGEPGALRFIAEHAGRFELELHHAHAELGVLEVLPR